VPREYEFGFEVKEPARRMQFITFPPPSGFKTLFHERCMAQLNLLTFKKILFSKKYLLTEITAKCWWLWTFSLYVYKSRISGKMSSVAGIIACQCLPRMKGESS
jgi:hypothetical protein